MSKKAYILALAFWRASLPMKIATININGYGDRFGAWAFRRELIIAFLRALAPEVVLLQAVARDPQTGDNQAAELARACRYPHWVCEWADEPPGVAILSQRSLSDVRSERLGWQTNPEDGQHRVLLSATVDSYGAPLRLVNGHFSWVASLNALHSAQALAAINAERLPVVFAGDLNATAESETMTQIAAAGWVDAWARLRGGDAGATFPADNPSLRIDYIWVSRELVPAFVRIEPFGNELLLSDHLGLMLTLTDGKDTG